MEEKEKEKREEDTMKRVKTGDVSLVRNNLM